MSIIAKKLGNVSFPKDEERDMDARELELAVREALVDRFPANGGVFKDSLVLRVCRNALKLGSITQAINKE